MLEPSAKLVVTLPPSRSGEHALTFIRRAKALGADLLEIRSDFHSPGNIDVSALGKVLPLLLSQRGKAVPKDWIEAGTLLDQDLSELTGACNLVSHHAEAPMTPQAALDLWKQSSVPRGASIKHVEPLGPLANAHRLLETQQLLVDWRGPDQVTVLAMGPLALPFRALLSTRNALDYVALDGQFSSAAGQRLLVDAARSRRGDLSSFDRTGRTGRSRLGIIGAHIEHSHSPRIHPQPFDRLDFEKGAPLSQLLAALHPYYRGFAVTAPFKKDFARVLGSPLEAINTLVRTRDGWNTENTDVDGAKVVLAHFKDKSLTVLGDGGAASALKMAARITGHQVQTLRSNDQSQMAQMPLAGNLVWTWPPTFIVPDSFRFAAGAQVAVIAYAAPARQIAQTIRQRGGVPLSMGVKWFIAQARKQRQLWDTSR